MFKTSRINNHLMKGEVNLESDYVQYLFCTEFFLSFKILKKLISLFVQKRFKQNIDLIFQGSMLDMWLYALVR